MHFSERILVVKLGVTVLDAMFMSVDMVPDVVL